MQLRSNRAAGASTLWYLITSMHVSLSTSNHLWASRRLSQLPYGR
ncbi:uncharacterized protein HMPREF1541_06869 [Cyphellophora europaea CBS 101466]|uniref:Uncharacterized protein n=1 Tax=Cyphellophora europaea (strain CBS 101466) TaxID=1220924 RepID=W2RR87_CYPE1|nr:uncharacterized protein HMPREF1541_06869 [Cyphellophora europaea CBS 101466]ETN38830.1 hypothetical protein HMPREF1541_06869 [Cyphellophora europaea CBS 101466]